MKASKFDEEKHWYAMRDLKRPNAILPAYKQLTEAGFEVFTPMKVCFFTQNGKRTKREVPIMRDLIFVYASRCNIDPIVEKTPTLQYRFKKGGKQAEPIIVPDDDMLRFISAVKATDNPTFYSAEEITPLLCGRTIRMVGGVLDGYEGILQTVRGSKTKHLIVTISTLLAVGVDIHDEFVELL